MTPHLPVSTSPLASLCEALRAGPSLPPSSLCRHTLADLRAWLAAARLNHIRPTCAVLPLTIAAHPEGRARARFTQREIKRCQKRDWGKHVMITRQSVAPRGGLYNALGVAGAAECASIARVLRKLVKVGFQNADIAILVHASAAGGVTRNELYQFPFSRDVRNRQTLLADTVKRGLLRVESRHNPAIGSVQRYLCLTDVGEKLLLGQWGKAVRSKDEGRMMKDEGRKAA